MRPGQLCKLLAVVFCLTVCGCASIAQADAELQVVTSQPQTPESEELYLVAVNKAEALGPLNLQLAVALENLGSFYLRHGRYSDAESAIRRAIEICLKQGQGNSPEWKYDRTVLARICQAEGKDAEAAEIYISAVEEARNTGPDSLPLAEALWSLGSFYEGRREYGDAEPLLQEELQISEKLYPPDDHALVKPLSDLIMLFRNMNKPEQAEPLMLRKLGIEAKLEGEQNANFAQELVFLSELYAAEGKYKDAETVTRRAIDTETKLYGAENPAIGSLLVSLARLATSQKHYDEAEGLYKRALQMQEKALGPNGPGNLQTLSELGQFYDGKGDHGQAQAIYEQVLTAQLKSQAAGSGLLLGTVERLGPVYEEEDKFAQAESLYRMLVETDQKVLPHGHLAKIASLNDLAEFCERRGRFGEADKLYTETLAEFDGTETKGESPMDSNRAIVMRNYARLLRKMNRVEEAKQYEADVEAIDKRLAPKPLTKK